LHVGIYLLKNTLLLSPIVARYVACMYLISESMNPELFPICDILHYLRVDVFTLSVDVGVQEEARTDQ